MLGGESFNAGSMLSSSRSILKPQTINTYLSDYAYS